MKPQCVITGCSFIHPTHGHVSGDLFDGGMVWIFHGNWNSAEGEPRWLKGDPVYARQIVALDWLEIRGVFIMKKKDTSLNQAAQEHIL